MVMEVAVSRLQQGEVTFGTFCGKRKGEERGRPVDRRRHCADNQ